ncbi:MAG: hypothetical protein QOD06_2963 [Candidatus Binatota bacterium]|nr:hypothetical protein [Candidatus Binatota bacterium]
MPFNASDEPNDTAVSPMASSAASPRDPRSYATEEILRDGGSICIRAIRPIDGPLLLEHFGRLSPRSVYLRFFGPRKRLSEEEVTRLTELDFTTHVGLLATLLDGGAEHVIGVGRYIVVDSNAVPRGAEVAFAVLDEHQGRGVGSLLLQHLARIAETNGICEFEADVLGDNERMLDVFAASGFTVKRSTDAGVVHLSFPTEETDASRRIGQRRERQAAARSIRSLLQPGAVAIIGASRNSQGIGSAILRNLISTGFNGRIYPIHPEAAELEGLPAFAAVTAVGSAIDLAVVAVPQPSVEAVIADCARANVHSVVVISSGFAEASDAGRLAQERLKHLVRGSGMRMVGPNCIGVLNTDPAVRLNATFSPVWPPAGNVAVLSQSGALGIALLEHARARGIGISTFVSVGNKADVSGNDLLAYWAEDPRTRVIALYLESFGNPRKFARVTPDVARQKPIVAVKSGRSAAGSRAASSHSAALANLDVAVDALFEQAGVMRTNTLEELFDLTALLSTQPLPPGPRVGVVTNAGGPGILLADACEAKGLTLPELTSTTREALAAFLPPQAGLANPVDMLAAAGPEDYERAIAAVGNDPTTDAVVVIYIPPLVTRPDEIAAGIARGAAEVPTEKPIATVFLSGPGAPAALGGGPRGPLPSYTYPENAAIALAAAERHARWRRRTQGEVLTLDESAATAVRAVVDRVLEEADGPRWLSTSDVATVLSATGVELAGFAETSPDDSVAAAERLGYPVVAKAISSGVLHKSDVGGVILGLDSRPAVAAAVDTLRERLQRVGAPLERVLLQRQVDGVEALVGVTMDPTFGPLVVCGFGGVLVELVRDVAFRLTPLTDSDAAEMIDGLRSRKLLDGYRGGPAADREALIAVIRRAAALVEIVPELRELDMNPVKLLAPGRGAIVVDARMRIGPLS